MTEAERIEPSKWRKKYNDLETKMRIDKEAKKFADDCPHYSYEAEKGYKAGTTAENNRLREQLLEERNNLAILTKAVLESKHELGNMIAWCHIENALKKITHPERKKK